MFSSFAAPLIVQAIVMYYPNSNMGVDFLEFIKHLK